MVAARQTSIAKSLSGGVMNKLLKIGLVTGLLITVLAIATGCSTLFPTATDSTTGEATSSGSIWPMLIFLVVIFAMFYFVMIRPQRKRQKEQQTMMASLQKGDKVMTIGGIYGTIDSINDESIVLKVEGGTTIRVARTAVNKLKEPTANIK
jgi:preprotein translocase subunit YajC